MTLTYLPRATVDDAALSALHQLAFSGEVSGEVIAWSARLEAHSLTWICAYEDDTLIGFVNACWDGGCHAFLIDTVVEPSRQGRGIGREMVRRLVAQAQEAGCEWLHVDYEPQLEPFYRRCGFAPTSAGLMALR